MGFYNGGMALDISTLLRYSNEAEEARYQFEKTVFEARVVGMLSEAQCAEQYGIERREVQRIVTDFSGGVSVDRRRADANLILERLGRLADKFYQSAMAGNRGDMDNFLRATDMHAKISGLYAPQKVTAIITDDRDDLGSSDEVSAMERQLDALGGMTIEGEVVDP